MVYTYTRKRRLRPIVMQSDSQSVEKYLSGNVRMSFCPENVRKWSSSPQNESEFYPRSTQSCFPLLQGPAAENHRQHVFHPTGSNTIKIRLQSPIGSKNRSKRCWRWFRATGLLETRETALGRSWRNCDSFCGGEGHFPSLSGQKLLWTYQRGTFSTECKSDCIRIGLRKVKGKKQKENIERWNQNQTCTQGAGRVPRGQSLCLLVRSFLWYVQLMDQQKHATKDQTEDKTRRGQRQS